MPVAISVKLLHRLMNFVCAGVALLALFGAAPAMAASEAAKPDAKETASEATPTDSQDSAKDPARTGAFDKQLFTVVPSQAKNYACFVRRYDADHLKRHPLQKVSAMKLLVNAETNDETKNLDYSFRLGVQYRHRKGAFDSSGSCGHIVAEVRGNEIRLGCGVDCDGGGIDIAMKNDQSSLVRLERIRMWQNNKPDDEAGDELIAGADDKIFRLDRASIEECASLVTDRKELAAMRKK